MTRTQASAILHKLNTLLASEGNTQAVQSYVAQLEGAGYPLTATIQGNTVIRYREEIVEQRVRRLGRGAN